VWRNVLVAIRIVEVELMKMFLIVYNSFHDERVTNAFKQAGYKFYTKTRGATGEGADTLPKLHSHFFPGTNNLLFVAVPDEEIPRIVDFAQILKAENPGIGLRGFIFPLEQCV
jgi:hypothetical protein